MAISIDSLKLFAAERMSDNDDGGGRMSATEIVSGVENSIFDDVSDVDRAAGDCSLRKIYAAVASADTDKYLDAGIIIFKAPDDPNVRVLATTTGSFYDERADIQNHIESYLVIGGIYKGVLYGLQIIGARTITMFGLESLEPPSINQTLCIVEGGITQFVRVTRIIYNNMEDFEDEKGVFQRRVIMCELSSPLNYTFHGTQVTRSIGTQSVLIYNTVVADAARYYGIRPLVTQAVTGNLSIYADGIYDRIVPTSQTETPNLDITAAAERTFAVPGSSSTISFTMGDTFSPNFTLYVGRAILPNSLSIVVSGGTLTDDGGRLMSGAAEIGTVRYTDGTVIFSSVSPTYSGSKTITFIPAAPLTRASNSFGIPITAETRFRTYVANLKPIPNAGTLVVDYLSQGNWYRLSDDGNGILTGASESYGAGTLNLTTGSVSLTLGAYADVYSSILFTYGSGVDTRVTTGTGSITFTLSFNLPRLVAGTVSLAWNAITLDTDDGNGNLSGTGGTATVNYGSGAVTVTPTTLPAASTVFTLAGDQYEQATFYSETFTPTPDVDGVISLTLAHTNTALGSQLLTYTLQADPDDPAFSELVDDFPGAILLDTKQTIVMANGSGGWHNHTGTINNGAGTLTLDTDGAFAEHTRPVIGYTITPVNYFDTVAGEWKTQLVPYETIIGYEIVTDIAGIFKPGSTVAVSYCTSSTTAPATATATLSALSFALSRPSSDFVYVAGSVQIGLGTRTYTDSNSRMAYGFNPATGDGTDAGSFDAASGTVTLADWPVVTNTYTQSSGSTRKSLVLVSRAVFRTPAAPVAVGSLSFRVTVVYPVGTGEFTLEGEADNTGVIDGSVDTGNGIISCYGKFDYQTGVADVYFGSWETATLHVGKQWYDASAIREDGMILKPATVKLDTLLYNCVTYSTLPLDSSIIGLDPVRLPSDGRVPVFKDGQLILVHNTQVISENSLSPTQVIDCERVRLYRVAITDANDVALSPEQYTLDRTLGTVTMKPTLDLTGLTGPYSIAHTVADLSVISDADLSGRLNLTKAVSHTYPADTSYVSGVLYAGTLQARITKLFEQSTWTSVWSDELIGSQPLAQFNDAQYPIQLTNAGAYPDRILIKFTSSTAFQVIGENLGLIGIGDTSTDCSPLNSLTGVAYFTIPYLGWGLGWATGNCLRFNVISAAYPIDLIRAIQPSDPSGLDSDSVELLLIGNIDA